LGFYLLERGKKRKINGIEKKVKKKISIVLKKFILR
jgi:hypothetical protein